MADVTPKTALTKSLTATILASIGREIIRRGEAVYFIERRGDTAVLTPSSFWNVFGTSSDPMEWLYHVDLPVPSGSRHVQIKGDRIIHSMYARDNFRPWRGLSPLQYASLTGDLGAAIETSLKQEESGPVANILPIPDSGKATGADGEEIDKTGEFKEHLEQAKGDTVLARSTSGAWDKGNYSKPSGDYVPTRLGPNPPSRECEPQRWRKHDDPSGVWCSN